MSIIKRISLIFFLCLRIIIVQGQNKAISKITRDSVFTKVDTLKAAVVTAAMRPHLKGDTIEYNVEHMAMPPNSVVEELLRRLPGLRVDFDGSITYNGEKIQHLLVDGQDIFGSQPTIVTRSFDASKIARIDILNQKSDQTLFTGIDDGSRTKTLNLVLKESAKNGYFGRVEAAGNSDNYYNGNGAVAEFREKEQFTAIGMVTNTGLLNSSYTGGAAIIFLSAIPDPLGTSAGPGIPQYAAAALHYANAWDEASDHLDGNYQYNHYHTQPVSYTQTYQSDVDSVYGQYQRSQSVNLQDQHWVDAKFVWAPDNRSALRIKLRGTITTQQNEYSAISNSTFNDTLVNSSQRNIDDKISREEMIVGVDFRTEIGRRAGRVFSLTSGISKTDATTNGHLYSLNQFFQPNGALESIDTIDQRKETLSHALNINSGVNFSEPLGPDAVLGVSYGFSITGDQPFQGTYDKNNGKYQVIVDSLSNNLKSQEANQHITLNLQGKTKKLSYTIGNDWLLFSYRQKDLVSDSIVVQHYINWTPRLMIGYSTSSTTSLSLNYNSTSQEPSISQLAPIKNNSNPLYIALGNPNLKPSLTQTVRLEFHHFKIIGINVNLSLNTSSNSISVKTITDSLGRQTSQPVNVDGGRGAAANVSIIKKILGLEAALHVSGNYSRSVNYVNVDANKNNLYVSEGGFSLSKFEPDKFNLQLNFNFTYFAQTSSVNTSAPVQYWAQNQQGTITLYFFKRYEFNTNATYTWQEKTNSFSGSTSVLLWNSSINRNLLHNRLAVKVQLNNMLNQNTGISRTNAGNVNTQNWTNILGRYWMLSAIYHFDKKFKQK